ncbi:type IV pili signal transduction protein PilI [Alcanivorax hongdengensis A-11-3]|uniref:Type IV pili signal transduction protein PilI n=1 Tax=Alcanivorax hongdengensis A-11-3 TaxID=1177179 RepID=L0W7S5_9GAMM|nr:chemotaxis protein CheW [Alcanivorax hongdengensis]EKF72941.1 type IV pili signal transduction protein PilI [Alcanivorax hongdengensis A-11-3]
MSTQTASAAYIKLADYNTRCREKANDLPMQQDAVSYWSGVGFVLDGRKYVAPLDEVSEILTVPAYTRIPGAQSWMKGVANVRGRLMTVMDLSGFLDKVSSIQEKRRRLLVLDEDDLYTGMAVDEVLGMQHFPIDSFVESLPVSDDSTRDYVRGAYQREGEYWSVFSLVRLAEDPRFMQVARTG